MENGQLGAVPRERLMNNHVQSFDGDGDVVYNDNMEVRDSQILLSLEEDFAMMGGRDVNDQHHPSQLSDNSNLSTSTINSSSYVSVIPNDGPSYATVDMAQSFHESSSSDNELVKFGQDIPVEALTKYGSQMANEVINQITSNTSSYPATHIGGFAADDDDDLVSPISNFMDERDFVVSEAVAVPQHSQVPLPSHRNIAHQPSEECVEHNYNKDVSESLSQHSFLGEVRDEIRQPEVNAIQYSTDEFDQLTGSFALPLSSVAVDNKHTLIDFPPSQPIAGQQVNQFLISGKPDAEPELINFSSASAESFPKENQLITLDNESVKRQNDFADAQSTEVHSESSFAVESKRMLPTTLSSNVATEDNTFKNVEQSEAEYSPSNESDTLASLPSDGQQRYDDDGNATASVIIPQSSSVVGMREEAAADEEEERTYERKGPLTIPASAIAAAAASFMKEKTNDDAEPSPSVEGVMLEEVLPQTPMDDENRTFPIRPPTPPKDFGESEEVKPLTVDLGPPPPFHYHHLVHRSSISGLHSILKRPEEIPWISGFTDPKILDIVYWRDPKRSGITLAIILFTLYLFSRCTIVSLLAYGALAVLGAALGFRAYKFSEAQLKKTDGSNPFKPYLEQEVIIPQEKLHAQMDVLIEHGQCVFKQLRHLFLVESLVDSVKFGLMLYTLTYIGSWFSGVTLVLIFIIALFSLPKVYELYKDPIDGNLSIAQDAINSARQTITGKFPFLKKVIEAEKKEQ